MTALIIVLISLFILTPLGVVLAVINDSALGIIAGVVLTTITHVAFWVMFGEGFEENGIFAFAGMYEFGTIVGILGIAWNALDLSFS